MTSALVAVKPASVCPAATVTVAGTVTFTLLLARETANPPAGAATVKETLQDVLPGVLSMVLAQPSPLKEVVELSREITADPPVAGIDVPGTVDATTLVSCTGIVVDDEFDAIWNVAVATAPSGMTLLFRPKIRHLFPEQETDLSALVVEGPATTVTPVMSDEKVKVHWRPAVCASPDELKLMGRETVPPGVPGLDPIDSVILCVKAALGRPSKAKRVK